MKKYLFLLTAVLALFAGIDSSMAQAWRGRGRITGTVTDSSGNPIEGVVVKFSSKKLVTSTEVKTDKKGQWTIGGIRGGDWDVDFSKDGYKTLAISAGLSEASYNQPIKVAMEKLEAVAPKESGPNLAKAAEGRALLAQKDYQGAIAKFQEALQEAPGIYQIYGDIASCYYQMGDSDKAIENYKTFLDKEKAAGVPTPDQQVQIAIASIYLNKKDIAKAKEYLAGVDESQITDPIVFYDLGVSYYNARDNDNAIKYFEKSVQTDPKYVDGYSQLAIVYVAKGDNAKAIEYFKKIIEIDPGSDSAKEAQGYIDSLKQ